MKPFLSEDFLLETETAARLYHDYAKQQPIFDYHCHLPVEEIAANTNFANLTRIWLQGDHYKWRAMRANGINEKYITGSGTDFEKFKAWAVTVPKALRNPLYHWTHLELKTPFGIEGILLDEHSAEAIYNQCNDMLAQERFSTCGLLEQMNVKVVCTTDDPVDNLEHHRTISEGTFCSTRVFPTFRPDKAMAIEAPAAYNAYLGRLEDATGIDIATYQSLLAALQQRHDYFHAHGCRLSDHGLEHPYGENFTESEVAAIFDRVRTGAQLRPLEINKFKSAILLDLARMDAADNWTQQFHFGAIRNTNTMALQQLGPDTGFDSIGDYAIAAPLVRFLDSLAREGNLTKTILYTLNPRDNELVATMIGNFQDGSIPGKMQFGSGWWFNDQKDGIVRQLNALSTMGLLSRFVGMLTDSRSFLSYPRHEYFRRILCNLFGTEVENGELPGDIELIGSLIRDICYENARTYFNLESGE